MRVNQLNNLKITLAISFIIVGIFAGSYAYKLLDNNCFGKIEAVYNEKRSRDFFGKTQIDKELIGCAGSGVDSANDGVAVGLGIISGFSILGAALLFSSLSPVIDRK
jgi:hypothetical protein